MWGGRGIGRLSDMRKWILINVGIFPLKWNKTKKNGFLASFFVLCEKIVENNE